mgnify:CR=1 FL=1
MPQVRLLLRERLRPPRARQQQNHLRAYGLAYWTLEQEEKAEWREEKRKALKTASENGEDTFSIAFDDAGESRLPPRSMSIPLPIDRIYVVERARCRVSLGWGNPTGGMTRILDTQSGEHAYVAREMLQVIK